MIDPRVIKLLKHPDSAKRKKAVSALAKTKDPEALKILARVYRTDEDAEVRELARKGGVYIKKNTASQQPARGRRSTPGAMDIDQYTQEPEDETDLLREVSPANQQRAAALVQQALDMNMNGNDAKAFDLLVRAFSINPRLELESYATNLATTISGLPRDEALAEIRSRARHGRSARSSGAASFSMLGILPIFMVAAGLIYISLFLAFNWIDMEISLADMLGGGALTELLASEGITEDQLAEIGGAEGLEMMLALFGMSDMSMQLETTALGFVQGRYELTMSFGEETQTETLTSEGEEREAYEYSPVLLGIVAVVQIGLGVVVIIRGGVPIWYWLQALAMTVLALIPFLWTYYELNSDIPPQFVELGIVSGTDMLGQGFWIGLGATALLGLSGLIGILSAPQPE